MRRRVPLLCGLLAFAALAVAVLWGGLYLTAPIKIERRGKVPVYVLSVDRNLVLCDSTGPDESGGLRPHVVNAATVRGLKRNIQCTIPGLEFQYCVTDPGGVSWMVTIPKFAPLACIAVAVLAWKGGRRRQLQSAEDVPSSPSSAPKSSDL